MWKIWDSLLRKLYYFARRGSNDSARDSNHPVESTRANSRGWTLIGGWSTLSGKAAENRANRRPFQASRLVNFFINKDALAGTLSRPIRATFRVPPLNHRRSTASLIPSHRLSFQRNWSASRSGQLEKNKERRPIGWWWYAELAFDFDSIPRFNHRSYDLSIVLNRTSFHDNDYILLYFHRSKMIYRREERTIFFSFLLFFFFILDHKAHCNSARWFFHRSLEKSRWVQKEKDAWLEACVIGRIDNSCPTIDELCYLSVVLLQTRR